MSSDLKELADELERLSWDFETRGNTRKALARAVTALRTLASQEKQEPVKPLWIYEDDLPDGYPYGEMFELSKVRNGVRMFPVYTAPQIPPPAAGWDEAIEDEIIKAELRVESLTERLKWPHWVPKRAHIEQARNTIRKLIESLRNPPSGAGVADDPAEYLASTALTNQPLAADSNASTEIGSLREKLSDALAGGLPHKSDCAVYLAPAYEPRPCDCGASNASAEARLREHKWFDPECHEKGCQSLVWRGFYETVVKGRADFREAFRKQRDQAKRLREALRNIAEGNLGGLPGHANYARIREVAREALSAHPHASDCDKQGEARCNARRCYDLGCFGLCGDETTKSEGGVEGHAGRPWPSPKTDATNDGAMASLSRPSPVAGIESGPSDRPADVTWGELHAFILKHGDEWEDEGVAARALLDAYGMWRR